MQENRQTGYVLILGISGSDYITTKPKYYVLFSQGLLNSLPRGFNVVPFGYDPFPS